MADGNEAANAPRFVFIRTQLSYPDVKDWFGDYDPNRFDEHPLKDQLARIANRRRTTPTKVRRR